jgi:hypothetical protein
MSIAALIRQMADAGAPIDAILIAVEAIEASQAAIEAKRAADRERKKRQRERDKTVTVTGQDRDCHSDIAEKSPPFSPPNDIYLTPPTIPPSSKSGARKGSRLPDDWQPKPLPSELAAAVDRWGQGEVEKQLSMFRDWAASATGSNAVKKCWDAAWRNWLRRVDGERPQKSSNGRGASMRDIGEEVRKLYGY